MGRATRAIAVREKASEDGKCTSTGRAGECCNSGRRRDDTYAVLEMASTVKRKLVNEDSLKRAWSAAALDDVINATYQTTSSGSDCETIPNLPTHCPHYEVHMILPMRIWVDAPRRSLTRRRWGGEGDLVGAKGIPKRQFGQHHTLAGNFSYFSRSLS